jgi:hypothetical protein
MLFKTGDKFNLKDVDLNVEITGIMVGAQGVRIDCGTTNHYKIMINGAETYISEPILDLLLCNAKEQERKKMVEVKDTKKKR